jgi:hypothetical protein
MQLEKWKQEAIMKGHMEELAIGHDYREFMDYFRVELVTSLDDD